MVTGEYRKEGGAYTKVSGGHEANVVVLLFIGHFLLSSVAPR
jgi:hypothetical protein